MPREDAALSECKCAEPIVDIEKADLVDSAVDFVEALWKVFVEKTEALSLPLSISMGPGLSPAMLPTAVSGTLS